MGATWLWSTSYMWGNGKPSKSFDEKSEMSRFSILENITLAISKKDYWELLEREAVRRQWLKFRWQVSVAWIILLEVIRESYGFGELFQSKNWQALISMWMWELRGKDNFKTILQFLSWTTLWMVTLFYKPKWSGNVEEDDGMCLKTLSLRCLCDVQREHTYG